VKLAHANVVQVLDFGRLRDTLFIAMEYVDGLDLAALLRRYKERGLRLPLSGRLPDLDRAGARPRLRAPARRGAPRRLAVEYPAVARRRGEDRRLRHRGGGAAAPGTRSGVGRAR
jgi:hypothetical protein